MKLVLVSPKGPLYRYRGGIFKKNLRYAPITLPYLAALVPEDLGVDVRIMDEGVEEVDTEAEADLVAMTAITGSAKRTYELAARFRERGIPVVLGGPHATLVPEDAAPHVDTLVTGYAEQTWPRLLRDFAAGELKPRYEQNADLDLGGLPMPRWDLIKGSAYITTHVYEATRGCVHDCEFCVVPSAWGRSPYQRPVEDVVEEIRARGSRRAIFVDLNLIANYEYAEALFEALIPLKVKWFGLVSTLVAHKKGFLDLLQRSGCVGVLIGFETISDGSLAVMNKGFNTTDPELGTAASYRKVIDALHARGISIMGTFVFGTDEDRPGIFEETARFCIDAAIDLPRFAISTPFPGTSLFRRLERAGRIVTRDWDLYDGQHVVFEPRHMSAEELQAGHELAWKMTYTRLGVLERLWRSRVQLHTSIIANIGYRYYANHLHSPRGARDAGLCADGAGRAGAA